MTGKRYEIEDHQWEQISELFPRAKTGRPRKNNRDMFNTILWIARSGAAWRDLPERYGHGKRCTADSANGAMMEPWKPFFMR